MRSSEETISELAKHYRAIIELIGEDPEREGLRKTPLRAAKALYYATSGYRENAHEIMRQAVFEHSGSKIVMVKDIEFYSFCEHHILPFFGKISVAYIPDGEIIGLSKLARVVNTFARRLQVQERLTAEVCRAVASALSTKGVMAVCQAEHLCMKMRGVEKQDSSTLTTEYTGAFAESAELRQEFYQLLK
ncbi:MAG: GTP cyclohydrolase I FolE [Muribaculum sp.]|nr:GTP cyclohydrolase I FolE [Muribaculaceae bacterium]MCM1081099.1 GTP cyclohydrolase I FolE [Muribaculum sp.]